MTDSELKEEMRQDMLNEAYEDIHHEARMSTDIDYAKEHIINKHDLDYAYNEFCLASDELTALGYEYSPSELFGEM